MSTPGPLPVVWTETALAHLAAIRAYIAQTSEFYAERMVERVLDRGPQLAAFPDSGRMLPELQSKPSETGAPRAAPLVSCGYLRRIAPMYRKPSLVLSAVALLISCHSFDPDDVHVLVRTDAASYVAPADVLVRVVNLSAGTLHHGLCLEVERREGAEWVALEYDDEEIPTCPSVLVITKPRQQQELGAHIEDPGEYRLLLWVSTSDSERVDHPFISNAFTIDPGAD